MSHRRRPNDPGPSRPAATPKPRVPATPIDVTSLRTPARHTVNFYMAHLQRAGLLPMPLPKSNLRGHQIAVVDAELRHAWDSTGPNDLFLCRASLARDSIGLVTSVLHRLGDPTTPAFAAAEALYSNRVGSRRIDATQLAANLVEPLKRADTILDAAMYLVDADDLQVALTNPNEHLATASTSLSSDSVLAVFKTGLAINNDAIHPAGLERQLTGFARGSLSGAGQVYLRDFTLRGFMLRNTPGGVRGELFYQYALNNAVDAFEMPVEMARLLTRYTSRSATVVRATGLGSGPINEVSGRQIDTTVRRIEATAIFNQERSDNKTGRTLSGPHRRTGHFVDYRIKPEDFGYFGITGANEGASYFWRGERAGSQVRPRRSEAYVSGEPIIDAAVRDVGSRKPDAHLFGVGDVFWRTYHRNGEVHASEKVGVHPKYEFALSTPSRGRDIAPDR